MNPLSSPPRNPPRRQRGVVLFFTLIALLAMSLAAVALIRSVDTSTLIAGNLAFKQSATAGGDAGIEAAMTWLSETATTYNSDVITDPAHPFNTDGGSGGFANNGYYSSANPAVSLTDGIGIQWDDNDSMLVGTDAAGNTTRYVIQRMCRTADQIPGNDDCLFSIVEDCGGEQRVFASQEAGGGCQPKKFPQIRITARTTGPRNTVSYVQAFVY